MGDPQGRRRVGGVRSLRRMKRFSGILARFNRVKRDEKKSFPGIFWSRTQKMGTLEEKKRKKCENIEGKCEKPLDKSMQKWYDINKYRYHCALRRILELLLKQKAVAKTTDKS